MSSMQGFYASFSSPAHVLNTYLTALVNLSQINREQLKVLLSEPGWQTW